MTDQEERLAIDGLTAPRIEHGPAAIATDLAKFVNQARQIERE